MLLLFLLLSAPIPWSYWGGAGGGCPSPPPLCWMGLHFYTFPTIPSDLYTTVPLYPLYNGTTVPTIPLYWKGHKYSTITQYHNTTIPTKPDGPQIQHWSLLAVPESRANVGAASCHRASEFVLSKYYHPIYASHFF